MAADAASPNNIINALGTVLGYIGAEAATTATFTRLLWPQRSYSNLRCTHLLQLAFLLPAGGPLYKAALQTLDNAFKHGLFRGKEQGHMLGSIFFPDTGCKYTLRCVGSQSSATPSHTEASRNNLWIGVMALLPFACIARAAEDLEKGSPAAAPTIRARTAVRHLRLRVKNVKSTKAAVMAVDGECNNASIWTLLGIIVTELSGIVVAAIVALIWRSWFAVLWLCPLVLKLASAAAALRREPLDLTAPELVDPKAPQQNFEIHMPAESGTFLVITGPPALVQQFFRHYGHPKRDRVREVSQIAVIIALACLFPIGLLCSVAWMPLSVQYMWLAYQIYVVGAMYISRFLAVETWASSEEGIAMALSEGIPLGQRKGAVQLWADKTCNRVVEASLETSFFARYGEGQAHAKTLLERT